MPNFVTRRRLFDVICGIVLFIPLFAHSQQVEIIGKVTGVSLQGPPNASITEEYVAPNPYLTAIVYMPGSSTATLILDNESKRAMLMGILSRFATGQEVTLRGSGTAGCGATIIYEIENVVFE